MTLHVSNPNRVQFSIRFILVATATVAATVGAIVAKSPRVSVVAFQFLAVLFASLGLLVSLAAKGGTRVFWIGAAIPTAIGGIEALRDFNGMIYYWFQTQGGNLQGDLEIVAGSLRISLIVTWCIAPLNGLACVVLHRLFWPHLSPGQQEPDSKQPTPQ